MKKIFKRHSALGLLALLLLALPVSTFFSFSAQAGGTQAVKTISQPEQLQLIMDRLSSSTRVRSNFRQTKTMQVLRRPLTSKGLMIYEKTQGLYWHIASPFSSTLVVKSDRILQRNGKQDLIIKTEDNPQAIGFSQLFFHLLAGDFSKLKQHFNIELIQSEADHWKLKLHPIKPELSQLLTLITLQGSTDVESMALVDAGGDRTQIEFFQRHVGGLALSDKELAHFAF